MRKIDRTDVIKIMLVLSLVAGTGLAVASVGRFEPTHMITKEVYCGSCHPEEVQELNATTHLVHFTSGINSSVYTASGNTSTIPAAQAISDGCEMCHSYWDNFPNYGVTNFSLTVRNSTVLPITDIYGNVVSPSGLANTYLYNESFDGVVPWKGGIDNYLYSQNISGSNTTYYRLDYVWSALSAVSPMPAVYADTNTTSTAAGNVGDSKASCDSAEKGMCHIASTAVVQMELGKLPEASTLFRHEMAYTTDQYAAKPVKLCGACHVDKLPPMTWGGEPWSQGVIQAASDNGAAPIAANGVNNNPYDPFGFQPAYDSTGFVNLISSSHGKTVDMGVTYKTPDWAHANVPCIRCHEHAGINGATVSDNIAASSAVAAPYNKATPSLP